MGVAGCSAYMEVKYLQKYPICKGDRWRMGVTLLLVLRNAEPSLGHSSQS